MTARRALPVAASVLLTAAVARAQPEPSAAPTTREVDPALAEYQRALEADKLIDVTSGNLSTLRADLARAEALLRGGAALDAAVALFAIVQSPRYSAFGDFVEMHNAEYDLALALLRSGSFGASLAAAERVLARGPSSPYWGPAHRRAVDLALELRDPGGVLARLEAIATTEAIPVSAAGERAYLRGRAAYDAGKLDDAQAQLSTVTKKSRLYSSALYLRGVIMARQGQWKNAATAMCEIAGTPDDDKLTFVVDDRYFTIKDLARLGLGRLAHEQTEYDDAYYHYFQIPDDSVYLADALFEAAWSMYQKRELATARDLVAELLRTFPTAPMWPEASLLAGYIELADCKFDASQQWYDKVVAKLDPIVAEIDRIRKDPEARRRLVASALVRWREQKRDAATFGPPGARAARDTGEEVLALLRLDPAFVRLADAVSGAERLVAESARTSQLWAGLARQVKSSDVGKVSPGTSSEEDALRDAAALERDLARLLAAARRAQDEVARARAAGTLEGEDAARESERLAGVTARLREQHARARRAASEALAALPASSTSAFRPLLERDLRDARRLDGASDELLQKLLGASDELSLRMVERLYKDTRRVLDKARLGKVDAVIGQKRKLDIQVQDLASGRFPAELIGRLWNAGDIGDDEEIWPFEGEYWADEYEGYR